MASSEEEAEVKYSTGEDLQPLDQLVCDDCFEKNLTEDVHIQKCVVCSEIYCLHHASRVDPVQCAECLYDVSVTTEVISKTIISENKITGETKTTHSRNARQIKIGGLHWLFVQRKIPTLADEELELAIEYHSAIFHSLVYEREKRRAEHFHRNAGKKISIPSLAGTEVTTSTVIKKSRTTKVLKQEAAVVNFASAVEMLMKAGLTMEQIKNAAMGKK
jgi:hypothetical protein